MDTLQINIAGFIKRRITVFEFTDYATCKMIAQEIYKTHQFTPADPLKGNAVEQHFAETRIDLSKTLLLANEFRVLQEGLRMAQLLPGDASFNSFMAQQYTPVQEIGISNHRDGDRFDHLIAVLVLEAGGDFITYDNKAGENPVRISGSVGDVIIFDNTIHHAIINVQSPRFTVTGRIDATPDKKW
jgi:hypothetical protein